MGISKVKKKRATQKEYIYIYPAQQQIHDHPVGGISVS